MRNMILLGAFACITACVTPGGERDLLVGDPDDEEVAGAADGAPVSIDARATDDPEHIRAAALSASLAACHGYTTCPGGLIIGDLQGVNCGAPFCSTQKCGKSDDWRTLKQPREYYRPYAMPDGTVCLAYQPGTATNISCSCTAQ